MFTPSRPSCIGMTPLRRVTVLTVWLALGLCAVPELGAQVQGSEASHSTQVQQGLPSDQGQAVRALLADDPSDYVLAPGDLLRVLVYQQPDLSMEI
ncbi:MAG: Polysaccharide biosynthesis/export protein, partial [Pseudomonadota bacterium]